MVILADVGLPMVLIHWPLMVCALVPVIIAEGLIIRRWVSWSVREALIGMGKANLFSTLVGVPLAWLAMLALEYAVLLPVGLAAERWKWHLDGPAWQALAFLFSVAWLAPADEYLHWMVPAAVGLLLLPCVYLSVILERRSCGRTWSKADPARVRRGVFAANLASYALLFVLACGWAGFELVTKGPRMDQAQVGQIPQAHAHPATPPANGEAEQVRRALGNIESYLADLEGRLRISTAQTWSQEASAAQHAIGNIRIEIGTLKQGSQSVGNLESWLADLEARLRGANAENWSENTTAARHVVGNLRIELQTLSRGLQPASEHRQ